MVLSLRNGISDVPMYNVQLTVHMKSELTKGLHSNDKEYNCKQVENILYISLLLLGQCIAFVSAYCFLTLKIRSIGKVLFVITVFASTNSSFCFLDTVTLFNCSIEKQIHIIPLICHSNALKLFIPILRAIQLNCVNVNKQFINDSNTTILKFKMKKKISKYSKQRVLVGGMPAIGNGIQNENSNILKTNTNEKPTKDMGKMAQVCKNDINSIAKREKSLTEWSRVYVWHNRFGFSESWQHFGTSNRGSHFEIMDLNRNCNK